ncbi:hypothetical protein M0R45_000782 [Rubus argutus]|uniref:SET domain-containing protein n=1 Tax=Rubus argutus TaxID=59490 RepID=A0AAW1VNI2_RUBAR
MRDAPDDAVWDAATVAPDDAVLEEAVLCLVLTNAVEVQDKTGRTLGISQHSPSLAETPLRIVPGGRATARIESGVCSKNVLTKECQKYGPRVIVRSIRRINRGEEVTVTYTDLLQPKAIRQSELWSRYRFICSCRRCSASPLTYVDRALEEISAVNFNSSRLSSDISFNRDKATERLTDYVDDAIADYCQLVIPNLLVRGLSMYLHKVFVITSQRAMKKNRR